MASCPYCRKALAWMDELISADTRYKAIEIETIDESINPDIAKQFNYYLVPTYYVGGKKLHEGAASLEIVRRVFDAALKD